MISISCYKLEIMIQLILVLYDEVLLIRMWEHINHILLFLLLRDEGFVM